MSNREGGHDSASEVICPAVTINAHVTRHPTECKRLVTGDNHVLNVLYNWVLRSRRNSQYGPPGIRKYRDSTNSRATAQ